MAPLLVSASANAKFNATSAQFKKLQAQRVSRIKTLGRTIVRTLKHIDMEARDLVIQDMRDVTAAATELLAHAQDTTTAAATAAADDQSDT